MSINLLENKVEYVDYEEGGQEVILDDNLVATDGNEEYSVVDYSEGGMLETVYKKAARWVLLIGTALIPLFFLPWTTGVLDLNKQLLLVVFAGMGLVLLLL